MNLWGVISPMGHICCRLVACVWTMDMVQLSSSGLPDVTQVDVWGWTHQEGLTIRDLSTLQDTVLHMSVPHTRHYTMIELYILLVKAYFQACSLKKNNIGLLIWWYDTSTIYLLYTYWGAVMSAVFHFFQFLTLLVLRLRLVEGVKIHSTTIT